MEQIKATTILCVKKNDEVSISGDGQVSFGDSILKSSAKKVRTLSFSLSLGTTRCIPLEKT